MSAFDTAGLQLDNQLCFKLYAASRAVIRAYKPMLDELGLAATLEWLAQDLFARYGVKIDTDLSAVADYLRGKVVLVTGAGGSIGSEIADRKSVV